MTTTDLADTSAAADLWRDVFSYVADRVQKQLQPLIRTHECALECSWDDEVNLIQPGTRGTFAAPWHMDVQSVQVWCDAGSVTVEFSVAHATAPDIQAIIGTITASPFLLLKDTQISATLGPDDAARGAPDSTGYDLTNSGFLTELLADDMVYATITAGTPKVLGVKLSCVIRPLSGLDANTAARP